MRDEHETCDALPLDWIAARYLAASRARQPALLAPIAQLEALDAIGPGSQVGEAIARQCPEHGFGADDWGICTRNAARIAETRATEAAEAHARELAEQAVRNDPCQNGTASGLLTRFGYTDDAGNPVGPATLSACKALPGADGIAVIAVYRKRSPPDAQDAQDFDGDYDLHLMLADRDGTLLAQGHFGNAATSDAVSLDEVDIDPRRYALDARTSAFGVVTVNAAHCHQCSYSERALALFVRKGSVLRRVLMGFPVGSTEEAEAAAGCEGAIQTTARSIATAATAHHGFADLLVTTTVGEEPGFVDDANGNQCSGASEAGAPAAAPAQDVWVYDGKVYRQVKAAAR